MIDSEVPWWLELTQDELEKQFTTCSTCGTAGDSMDVVCPKDEAPLIDGPARQHLLTVAAYVLRVLVVLAALAIGYMHWAWPTYVVGVILAFAFALLFLRNHNAAFNYLFVTGVVTAAGHGIWATLAYPHVGDVSYSLVLITLLADMSFTARITVLAADGGRFSQLRVAARTIWIAAAAIELTSAGAVVLGIAYASPELVPRWALWGACHVTPLAASVASFAILVSSITYTIAAPPFTVYDIFHYREVLQPVRLGRVRIPDYTLARGTFERLAATFERVSIGFANGIITAIEATYNRQLRGLVNGIAHTAISFGNAVYKLAVKTARHIARVTERFFELALECVRWCGRLTKRFGEAFAAPIFLSWIACAELWWIAAEIRGYVLHEMAWATPLLSFARIAFIVVLLPASAMFMLRAPVALFGSKLSAAAGAVGGRAFLFFVFVAWTLGLVGWVTDGPFRIGWVTLVSTGIVVAALVALRTRRSMAVVPT